jgi:hypothetical protein
MFGSFLPNLLVGSHLQSLLGRGSRHCYGINYTFDSVIRVVSNACFRELTRDNREMQSRKLLISVITFIALPIAAVAILFTCHYFLLWKPSLEGKCGGLALNSPAATHPHLARFRGQVVGKNLSILQYRWLRRRFKAVGTTLSLGRDLPSAQYEGNVVRHGERVGDVVIDSSGRFDFGELQAGEYDLTVTFPGEDAVGFGFVIDPSAHNTELAKNRDFTH